MIQGFDHLKKLSLQITKENFTTILSGEQKIEHRYVYPTNAKQYVIETERPNGDIDIECVHYDALYLINGRRKNAPRLLVEVLDAEFVILTDEEGNDQTYMENGEEYLVCEVQYHLGKVLGTENV